MIDFSISLPSFSVFVDVNGRMDTDKNPARGISLLPAGFFISTSGNVAGVLLHANPEPDPLSREQVRFLNPRSWRCTMITAIGGWLGDFLGDIDGLMIALMIFMALDYMTGVMCAIIDKKVLILFMVGVTNIVDLHVICSGSALRGGKFRNIIRQCNIFIVWREKTWYILACCIFMPVIRKMKRYLIWTGI